MAATQFRKSRCALGGGDVDVLELQRAGWRSDYEALIGWLDAVQEPAPIALVPQPSSAPRQGFRSHSPARGSDAADATCTGLQVRV